MVIQKGSILNPENDTYNAYQELECLLTELRARHAREMNEALKRIGKATLELQTDHMLPLAAEYYEAKGKVFIADELLEKIALMEKG